jgi:hypothetical protein
MTMRLAHPALTTTGRKRGPQKWASAEQKRQHEQLEREWKQKTEEFQRMSRPVIYKSARTTNQPLTSRIPAGRNTTANIPSLNSVHVGAVSSPPRQQYTGDKVLGVTIVHKSCLQPVFSQEEAIDAARMRRG